jgi:hypothetical protein
MNLSIYSIKTISTSNYYAFRHNSITKVVYFRSYVDAQKVAAYLSLNSCGNRLYEYQQPSNIYVYHEYFEIEKQDKDLLNFSLALNNLGFHECKIVDDLVYCIDTGIFDIQSHVKSKYINAKLTTIMEA